jgi:hypothetical protein
MPVSSAPEARTARRQFQVSIMLVLVFALAAVALGMLTQRSPPIAAGVFGAQREQPSYRGNFTGHSRLRGQNYCTFSPWVLRGVQKKRGRAFIGARPRFLGKATKKYCTVKFSPHRERLSFALQIDPIRTLPCTSD